MFFIIHECNNLASGYSSKLILIIEISKKFKILSIIRFQCRDIHDNIKQEKKAFINIVDGQGSSQKERIVKTKKGNPKYLKYYWYRVIKTPYIKF